MIIDPADGNPWFVDAIDRDIEAQRQHMLANPKHYMTTDIIMRERFDALSPDDKAKMVSLQARYSALELLIGAAMDAVTASPCFAPEQRIGGGHICEVCDVNATNRKRPAWRATYSGPIVRLGKDRIHGKCPVCMHRNWYEYRVWMCVDCEEKR